MANRFSRETIRTEIKRLIDEYRTELVKALNKDDEIRFRVELAHMSSLETLALRLGIDLTGD